MKVISRILFQWFIQIGTSEIQLIQLNLFCVIIKKHLKNTVTVYFLFVAAEKRLGTSRFSLIIMKFYRLGQPIVFSSIFLPTSRSCTPVEFHFHFKTRRLVKSFSFLPPSPFLCDTRFIFHFLTFFFLIILVFCVRISNTKLFLRRLRIEGGKVATRDLYLDSLSRFFYAAVLPPVTRNSSEL